MSNIIAGYLQTQDQVKRAIEILVVEGDFAPDQISSFFVNPAGQHDSYELGGDRDKSPGAKQSGEGLAAGMATGGAIGAAIGMAGVVVAGPLAPAVGALLGAHAGGLVGSMRSMKEKGEGEAGPDGADNTEPQRVSGMLVAVAASGPERQAQAMDLLARVGAVRIEKADGTIRAGDWTDFDPLTPPQLAGRPAPAGA